MIAALPIGDGGLDVARTLRFSVPVDRLLLQTSGDTTSYGLWTEDGPATVRVRWEGDELVVASSGPGAAAALAAVPATLGLDDEVGPFGSDSSLLRRLHRRFGGFRLGACGRVFDVIVPTILGQRVTTDEAHRSYHGLVRRVSKPAPDEPGLYLPPEPAAVLALSSSDFHALGIERARARIVREAAKRAGRLEEILGLERDAAVVRLEAVRGVGPWTSAQVMGAAWGDRDAIPLGDYHLPNTVAWALAGEPRGDDDRMLELLEPYRPQRRRALLLIKMSGVRAPRYGPRSPQSIISRGGAY